MRYSANNIEIVVEGPNKELVAKWLKVDEDKVCEIPSSDGVRKFAIYPKDLDVCPGPVKDINELWVAGSKEQAEEVQHKITESQKQTETPQIQKPEEVAKSADAQENSAQHVQQSSSVYEVKAGDNLSTIAQKQGKTGDQLLAIPGNEQFKTNPDVIKPGDKVNLGEAQNTQPQSESVPVDQGTQNQQEAQKQAEQAKATEEQQKAQEAQKQAEQAKATEEQQKVQEAQKQVEESKTAEIQPNSGSSTYEVKSGDNLSSIAQGQGTTVDKLLAIPGNEKYKDNPDLIHPGDKVNIAAPDAGTQQNQPEPVQSGNQESPNTQASEPAHQEANTQSATSTDTSNQATEEQKQVEQTTSTEAKPESQGAGLVDSLNKFVSSIFGDKVTAIAENPATTYEVKAGDNLSSIAQANDTTVDKLAADNNISNPDHIEAGQSLNIGSDIAGGAADIGASGAGGYTVQAGDTLSEIAQSQGTTVNELASANNISNHDHIEAGQNISLTGQGSGF